MSEGGIEKPDREPKVSETAEEIALREAKIAFAEILTHERPESPEYNELLNKVIAGNNPKLAYELLHRAPSLTSEQRERIRTVC